jgi:asparagine synthase (glutamine-hydrolysing)
MGFPTPVIDFARGEAREFVHDVFTSQAARGRAVIDNRRVLESLEHEPKFGRKFWGLLSLELWQQAFHDRSHAFQQWSRPVVGEHAR